MLSKQYRLKKRKSFNYIYKRGRHIGSDVLTMSYVQARMKNIKIGFSVSKKIGNSVTRHKAIRKMRAAAKPLVERIAPNHSIIFVAKEGIDKKHVTEIQQAMEKILRKASLLSP